MYTKPGARRRPETASPSKARAPPSETAGGPAEAQVTGKPPRRSAESAAKAASTGDVPAIAALSPVTLTVRIIVTTLAAAARPGVIVGEPDDCGVGVTETDGEDVTVKGLTETDGEVDEDTVKGEAETDGEDEDVSVTEDVTLIEPVVDAATELVIDVDAESDDENEDEAEIDNEIDADSADVADDDDDAEPDVVADGDVEGDTGETDIDGPLEEE